MFEYFYSIGGQKATAERHQHQYDTIYFSQFQIIKEQKMTNHLLTYAIEVMQYAGNQHPLALGEKHSRRTTTMEKMRGESERAAQKKKEEEADKARMEAAVHKWEEFAGRWDFWP